jgi:hypothetical protein
MTGIRHLASAPMTHGDGVGSQAAWKFSLGFNRSKKACIQVT